MCDLLGSHSQLLHHSIMMMQRIEKVNLKERSHLNQLACMKYSPIGAAKQGSVSQCSCAHLDVRVISMRALLIQMYIAKCVNLPGCTRNQQGYYNQPIGTLHCVLDEATTSQSAPQSTVMYVMCKCVS